MTPITRSTIRSWTTFRLVNQKHAEAVLGPTSVIPREAFSTSESAEFGDSLHRQWIGEPPRIQSPQDSQDLVNHKNIISDFSHIEQLSAQGRFGGYRFSRQEETVWYCSPQPKTSVGEIAHHVRKELEKQKVYEEELVYQELVTEVSGAFCDLRVGSARAIPPELHPDEYEAYPLGQRFAERVRAKGLDGIVYSSVRKRGGTSLVVFHPEKLGQVWLGARWKLTWAGTLDHTAERIARADT